MYYPLYAYEHPLFTKDMQIYDEGDVSKFLSLNTVKEKMDILTPLIRNGVYMKIQDALQMIGEKYAVSK